MPKRELLALARRTATVISVRGKRPADFADDPDFVYVGRAVYRPKAHWHASPWGNPFKVGMKRDAAVRILGRDIDNEPHDQCLGPGLAIGFYRIWLRERSVLMDRLPELCGKRLGCWCGSWKPGEPEIACHAVVLAKLANALILEAPDDARP